MKDRANYSQPGGPSSRGRRIYISNCELYFEVYLTVSLLMFNSRFALVLVFMLDSFVFPVSFSVSFSFSPFLFLALFLLRVILLFPFVSMWVWTRRTAVLVALPLVRRPQARPLDLLLRPRALRSRVEPSMCT